MAEQRTLNPLVSVRIPAGVLRPRDAVEMEGVMPKEVIAQKTPKNELVFGWTKGQEGTVRIDLSNKFKFLDDDEIFTGLTFTFKNREEYNRAIRVLRKMRDDVYGRDE